MYDPLFDMVKERQSQMRQVAEVNHRLSGLRSASPRFRQRLVYNIGGMLITLGMRLRESAPEPCASTVAAASYSMPEGCR